MTPRAGLWGSRVAGRFRRIRPGLVRFPLRRVACFDDVCYFAERSGGAGYTYGECMGYLKVIGIFVGWSFLVLGVHAVRVLEDAECFSRIWFNCRWRVRLFCTVW